ncbi:MAG TPA: UDP-glucose--hexose-1-phosphate uridylyltransferase [Candidatus Angelobacter sp.]|jgi:UDPglucose--hexose-1-phosphate uridylyltransferase
MSILSEHPHRRRNALTGEWVLVSPQRTQRPWQGEVSQPSFDKAPAYDPDCYLCPGNERVSGTRNPDYTQTFVFTNDFPALYPMSAQIEGAAELEASAATTQDLLLAHAEHGISRVICFSPRHDLTMATMSVEEVRGTIETWAEQYQELGSLDWIKHVQIFENRGAMMGASNQHPHCQIWANASIPNEPAKELEQQQRYLQKHGRCLLCAYLALELEQRERLVAENAEFAVLTPFWGVWPFELMLLPKQHAGSLSELTGPQRDSLAEILKRTTSALDQVFQCPFPYSMGFHQSPTDGDNHPEWHMHAHFHPPLLRSATVRKFMVGYEFLAEPQRDVTPESAAAILRKFF